MPVQLKFELFVTTGILDVSLSLSLSLSLAVLLIDCERREGRASNPRGVARMLNEINTQRVQGLAGYDYAEAVRV